MKAFLKSPFFYGLLIVFVVAGVWRALEVRQQQQATAWQTIVTEDGRASVEMPGKPQAVGGQQLVLRAKGLDLEFCVGWGDLAADLVGEKADERLRLLPVAYVEAMQKHRPEVVELVRSERVAHGNVPGMEIVLRVGPRVLTSRTYYADGRSYAIEAVTSEATADSPAVKRFFDAFQIKPAAQP